MTGYLAPLNLPLDHLSGVVGVGAGHALLGAAVGTLWGFGVRQGIHGVILGKRNLGALQVERSFVREQAGEEHARHTSALLRQNRSNRRQTHLAMVVSATGAVGAAGIGLSDLFRQTMLGALSPVLAAVALPLAIGTFVPLVVPAAVGTVDRGFRAMRTRQRISELKKYIETHQPPRADLLARLCARRQNELGKYYTLDCAAFATLAVGLGLSIFLGPIGLALAVPGSIGAVIGEAAAQRVTRVADALPLDERLRLVDDATFADAIADAHRKFRTLRGLRKLRYDFYPPGWGTPLRPLLRVSRRLQGRHVNDAQCRLETLAAARRGTRQLRAVGPGMRATSLMRLMNRANVRAILIKELLDDRRLRVVLQGHGICARGKEWTVDTRKLAYHLEKMRGGSPSETAIVDKVYKIAEEVLLTRGKTEAHRRERALVDAFSRFARTASAPSSFPTHKNFLARHLFGMKLHRS